MVGWMVQMYGYEPGRAGAVKVTVCPDFTWPVSKALSAVAVTVWVAASLLVTVTFVPGATVTVAGWNAKSLIVITAPPVDGEAARLGEADDAEPPPPPEQPVRAAAQARGTTMAARALTGSSASTGQYPPLFEAEGEGGAFVILFPAGSSTYQAAPKAFAP